MTTYNVYNQQFSGGITLNYSDTEKVFYGGTSSATINEGTEYVEQGGVNEAATLGDVNGINEGGEYVLSGGIDEGTTILAGTVVVASGALVQGLTVSGQYSDVYLASGATLQDVTFIGGGETVNSANLSGYELTGAGLASLTLYNSLASNTEVDSGGTLIAASGGVASGVTVYAGGTLAVGAGSVVSATIYAGGVEELNGTAGAADVLSSGAELEFDNPYVTSGQLFLGTATTTENDRGAILSSGGVAIAYGQSYIGSGVVQTDASGAAPNSSTIDVGGVEQVLLGGESTDSSIFGKMIVFSGGTVDSPVVDGTLELYGGATATNLDFEGGTEIVAAEYSAVGSTVVSGGLAALIVSSGASVLDTVVSSGGALTVSSAGASLSGQIGPGGVETVLSGGSALNDQVLSGGGIVDNGALTYSASAASSLAGSLSGSGRLVADGPGRFEITGVTSAFTGALVLSGGSVELERSYEIGTAKIEFEQTSGTVTLDVKAAPTSGKTFPSVLVDFNASTKQLDLLATTYVAGATATVSGNTLVLKDGGYIADFSLGGMAAASYVVASDGHSGTLIEASASNRGRFHSLLEASAAMTPREGVAAIHPSARFSDEPAAETAFLAVRRFA